MESSAGSSAKNVRRLVVATRQVIDMTLDQDRKKHQVKAQLNTQCSVALINDKTTERLRLKKEKHRQVRRIENYTGERVAAAGRYYMKPLLLQHQRHYSKESFEVSPMDPEIDIFLPFSWIQEHPPQGTWTNM